MSASMTFKCPCCGGFLEFDPTQQKFKCHYCGQSLSEEELRDQSEAREAEAEAVQAEAAPAEDHLKTYNCQMCGAEIVTDETTAATIATSVIARWCSMIAWMMTSVPTASSRSS